VPSAFAAIQKENEMKRKAHFLIGMFLLFLVFINKDVTHAQKQTQTGKLTYVTSTTAYVDLGTNHGFDLGDTLHVMKGKKEVADLVVTNIASKSMSTSIVSKSVQILAGDEVHGIGRHQKEKQSVLLKFDSTALTQEPLSKKSTSTVATVKATGPEGTQFRGRVSLQYYALASNTTAGFDFSQPALALNMTAENLLDLPLQFSLYSNHRYDARSQENRSGNAADRLTNRVYQFAFEYGHNDAPFSTTVGRFLAPAIGGVGTFDGVMVIARNAGWEAGLVGGSQPGYSKSEVNFDDPKMAAYIGYTAGDYQSTRYQGSLAYAQTYKTKSLDRGFVYMQHIVSFENFVSLYQNANIDLYDMTNGSVETKPHLSDFFLSSTYRPIRWLSVNGSYAVRRNVYYLRSFAGISDSLFDKSFQQNTQLSVGMNLPMAMFVSLSGSMRAKEGDANSANALSARYSWSNVLSSQITLYLSGSLADNIYNTSKNLSIELNRDFSNDLYLSVRASQYSYSFTTGNRTLNRQALSADVYYRLSHALYASFSVERYWEGAIVSDRLYTELSIRF